jgi:hypothetical protein
MLAILIKSRTLTLVQNAAEICVQKCIPMLTFIERKESISFCSFKLQLYYLLLVIIPLSILHSEI